MTTLRVFYAVLRVVIIILAALRQTAHRLAGVQQLVHGHASGSGPPSGGTNFADRVEE